MTEGGRSLSGSMEGIDAEACRRIRAGMFQSMEPARIASKSWEKNHRIIIRSLGLFVCFPTYRVVT